MILSVIVLSLYVDIIYLCVCVCVCVYIYILLFVSFKTSVLLTCKQLVSVSLIEQLNCLHYSLTK
jgi:hypothetical protein